MLKILVESIIDELEEYNIDSIPWYIERMGEDEVRDYCREIAQYAIDINCVEIERISESYYNKFKGEENEK